MVSDKPKIFIVVEDRKTLALLQAVLQPNGYEVIKAANGSEVLEALKRGLGELVILDDQVSKMNCYEVCQKIKEELLPKISLCSYYLPGELKPPG